ncbi:bacterial transcriptional activator domain-containing protein [Kribbella sp. NBC_00482]|uniref:bacterial transcriptional activator domain-containing protein n=1 Tax=Kribbella sp. NBC_00482 TaxID=2975968 RepID=UPI003FA55A23
MAICSALRDNQADLRRLDSLAAESRSAVSRQLSRAAACLGSARNLFQGAPFGGVAGRYVESQRRKLRELHHQLQSERLEILIQTGRLKEALTEHCIARIPGQAVRRPTDVRVVPRRAALSCLGRLPSYPDRVDR